MHLRASPEYSIGEKTQTLIPQETKALPQHYSHVSLVRNSSHVTEQIWHHF